MLLAFGGFIHYSVFLFSCLTHDFVLIYQSGSTTSLELDLESYVVPLPTCANPTVYAANLAETPRSAGYNKEFPKCDASRLSPSSSTDKVAIANHAAPCKVFTGNLIHLSAGLMILQVYKYC